MHYSCLKLLCSIRIYVSLYFLLILLKSQFFVFLFSGPFNFFVLNSMLSLQTCNICLINGHITKRDRKTALHKISPNKFAPLGQDQGYGRGQSFRGQISSKQFSVYRKQVLCDFVLTLYKLLLKTKKSNYKRYALREVLNL